MIRRGQILITDLLGRLRKSRITAGSPPISASTKGNATPSFIANLLCHPAGSL